MKYVCSVSTQHQSTNSVSNSRNYFPFYFYCKSTHYHPNSKANSSCLPQMLLASRLTYHAPSHPSFTEFSFKDTQNRTRILVACLGSNFKVCCHAFIKYEYDIFSIYYFKMIYLVTKFKNGQSFTCLLFRCPFYLPRVYSLLAVLSFRYTS